MKNKKNIKDKKTKKLLVLMSIISLIINSVTPVYAADDPLTVINNLSDFIFSVTRAIGTIILVISLTQIGMSYQSHDPSQKTNGFYTFLGGIIITFSKEILNLITG